MGYPKDRMKLLRVGCNAVGMPQLQNAAARQQLGLPSSETILCYVGALLPRDAELLLGSLRVLKDRVRRMPQTVLVGNHQVEEDVRRELSISVTGYLREFREVAAYLGAADYGLVPMRLSVANMARWPSKTGDYWAAGLPVIATPVSDYAELFPRHDLGFLAAGDSPEDLACAMEAALAAQAEERDRMSRAAKVFAEHELEWSVVALRLEEVFRSAMEVNGSQAVRA
jgi:glycosyltransferase involved in cell wall biosynthesis